MRARGTLKALVAAAVAVIATGSLAADSATAAGSTTATEWKRMPWGELGTTRMDCAPFPDDSRTTGFESTAGRFPREGHYDDNTVAFCVPNGYRAGGRVDLVVLLHGHTNTCERFIEQARAGEALERSGRNAIVVVPQDQRTPRTAGAESSRKREASRHFLTRRSSV